VASQTFHDHLNSQHPAIQFTVQEGVDEGFLLNALAEGNDTLVHTLVFQTKAHTNHYINFNSHRHPRILIGVIKYLLVWPDQICHNSRKTQELEHLEQVLCTSGFTSSTVMKSLYQKHHHTHQTTAEDDRQKVLYLLYVCDISERT